MNIDINKFGKTFNNELPIIINTLIESDHIRLVAIKQLVPIYVNHIDDNDVIELIKLYVNNIKIRTAIRNQLISYAKTHRMTHD